MNTYDAAVEEFLGWTMLEHDYDMVPTQPPGGLKNRLLHSRGRTPRVLALNKAMPATEERLNISDLRRAGA